MMTELHNIGIALYDMARRVEQELGAGLHGSQIRDLADKILAIDHTNTIKFNDLDARD
jgi:hypothetical protein